MNNLSIIALIMNASIVVKLVMLLLVIFSITSWAIIFYHTANLQRAKTNFTKFKELFYSDIDLHDLYAKLSVRRTKLHAVEAIFVKSYREFLEHNYGVMPQKVVLANIERKMRIILAEEQNYVETKLSVLASIQSMSPYIGLFGTVWGIMQSFRGLGLASNATLAVVAPGIAEALIATALGLIVAIPAGLAYNRLLNITSWLSTQYQIFAEQVLGLLEYKMYTAK